MAAFLVMAYLGCCILAYGLLFEQTYRDAFPNRVPILMAILLCIFGPFSLVVILGVIIFDTIHEDRPLRSIGISFFHIPDRNIIVTTATQKEAKRWLDENEMPYYECHSAFGQSVYGFRSTDHALAFKMLFG